MLDNSQRERYLCGKEILNNNGFNEKIFVDHSLYQYSKQYTSIFIRNDKISF